MSSAEENKAIARHLEEELARGNLDVIDELLAPDFVDRALLPGQGPTREDFKRGEYAPLSSRGGAGREVLSIPPFPKPSFERRKGDGEGLDDILPWDSPFDCLDRPEPEFLRVDAHAQHRYTGPLYSQAALAAHKPLLLSFGSSSL